MKNLIAWGLRISIILFAILHFITAFYVDPFLTAVLAVSGLFTLFFSILHLNVTKIKLPLVLFLSAVLILILSDTSIQDGFFNGLLQMRNVIGLLVIVPMIGWVMNEDFYVESLLRKTQNFLNSSQKMYAGMISFTQIISYFLLFGAIPLVYHLVNKLLKNEQGEGWERYKGTAVLRGFSLSVLWVITMPSFIFVVETMNASLWISILQGLGIALVGILIAVVFSFFEEKRSGVDVSAGLKAVLADLTIQGEQTENNNRLVIEFILLFVSLFGTIILFHNLVETQLLILIPLVIVCWTLVYFLLKKKLWKFLASAKNFADQPILNQSYQLSVMLGAGMLIYALNQTGFGSVVISGINTLQNAIPFLSILHLLPFMVLFLGFFGLGPLTVMVLVAGILETLHLPYAPELIVITVTSGSALSILLSPLLMPNIVLSGVNGLSGLKNGVQFNWKFAVFLYFIVQLYVGLMIQLGF